jgi:hypothetical protein
VRLVRLDAERIREAGRALSVGALAARYGVDVSS